MIRIFRHYINAKVVLQMIFDIGFVLVALSLIGALFPRSPIAAGTVVSHGLPLALWTFLVGALAGVYQSSVNPSVQRSIAKACVAALLAVPLAYAVGLVLGQIAGAEGMQYAAMATVLTVIGYRTISAHLGGALATRSRILVLGTGLVAKQVRDSLQKSNPRAEIIGFFPSPNEQDHAVPRSQIVENTASLAATATRARADEVVVALTERRSGSMSLRDLLDCKISGIRVSDVSTHFEKRLGQIKLDYVNAGWLIFGDGFNQGFWRTSIKRVFDLLSATVLLVVFAPLMFLTMLLIALETPGPIFYRQQRVGLNGKAFDVVKFRSMRSDAEADGQPRWASAADDRITRVGRLIRRVRIDELPQLWNVLKGEMSLVGPRPERPFFVEALTKDIPYYAVRHSVKPGVTGWAQVRYDYGSTVEDAKHKLQYDLYYVKNHTLFLDLLIMAETVTVVLTGKGAR
ncbi:MAG TPA: TIGR03013 family XrtA/PEP-CTERM system glycosyltransferase [Burkholderiaceae bacterium]|nr:TIGR03013 family XrtA/PEP-CTERM system glycosyltransferase [Burkholderiaceae bacterium]